VVAASIAQSRGVLGAAREHLRGAEAIEGNNIKHDISVPVSRSATSSSRADAALGRPSPVCAWSASATSATATCTTTSNAAEGAPVRASWPDEPAINAIVYDAVAQAGGSISAEHGLGQLKVGENQHYKSAVEICR
jgi:FAD/FMN-containing dehydrogenase